MEAFGANIAARLYAVPQIDALADRLDEDEKGVSQIHTPGGDQSMTIINESGLYNVTLHSFTLEPLIL